MDTSPTPSARGVSLAILTYQRNYLLQRQLEALSSWHDQFAEIIVVDNAAETSTLELCKRFPWVRLIQAPRNLGAAGRNLAFEAVRSEFLVTLDDDVLDLQPAALPVLFKLFTDPALACINFKVLEEGTGRLVNWVHHRPAERFSNETFDTYEITEGAVAFRTAALKAVGGYPESFFLSHEGPDLAWRLMDQDWRVIYSPQIVVTHLFAPEGRASWRNYYYDTRNTLWLAIRHLPVLYGVKLLLRQNCAMAYYSLRDGFVGTWLRAWGHALVGAPREWRGRKRLRPETMKKLRLIDAFRTSFLKTALVRLRSPSHKLSAD